MCEVLVGFELRIATGAAVIFKAFLQNYLFVLFSFSIYLFFSVPFSFKQQQSIQTMSLVRFYSLRMRCAAVSRILVIVVWNSQFIMCSKIYSQIDSVVSIVLQNANEPHWAKEKNPRVQFFISSLRRSSSPSF